MFTLLSIVAHAQFLFITSSQGDGSAGSEAGLHFAARGFAPDHTCSA
jgi:hypothetical protein